MASKYETYARNEIAPQLAPGEQVLHTAFLFNKSLVAAALIGPLAATGSGYFFAVATDRRLFLIKTKMGLFSLKAENHGLTEIRYETIAKIDPGGMLNQKTLAIHTVDGGKLPLKLNTIAKFMSGQKTFIDSLPRYVEAWKQQGGGAQYGGGPQQQYGGAPQQQHGGAPPHQQHAGAPQWQQGGAPQQHAPQQQHAGAPQWQQGGAPQHQQHAGAPQHQQHAGQQAGPQPGAPGCPRCGQPLEFVAQYQRWFCGREQQYV